MYDNEYDAASLDPINASNYFGYPHLGYPGNHYDYTVFDALFCWDENTEHLTGNRKDPNSYIGMDSPIKPIVKNFLVEEAEPDFIFLQNMRIGFFARPNYIYRVDYEAGNTILLGDHVTQKTDFVDLVIEPNAVVDAQAVTEIHFTPGVHIKHGADMHAYIGDIACEKSLASSNTNPGSQSNPSEYSEFLYVRDKKAEEVSIFPNPSKQSFSVRWNGSSSHEVIEIHILELSGKEIVKKRVSLEEPIVHELKPGFYLVKLIKDGVCTTRNILIEY